ncbi:MAG: hypothetical protein GWO00_03255, partial [Gemmatimonadetes bacterium]|nr:hypothetical protein [Gemmatimonadota bacterium]NIT86017.1 hypothetical protein [Gemmatimonadota bacterium]NIU29837.1 hypothetical protein [Gemmatimonadota bacterium]NIV60246.1 hypothetical protein [Gemmatimonadota bacterium]NIW62907.1 hypothetical protein [Gemmatimonadota bacterium]
AGAEAPPEEELSFTPDEAEVEAIQSELDQIDEIDLDEEEDEEIQEQSLEFAGQEEMVEPEPEIPEAPGMTEEELAAEPEIL